MYGTIIVLNTYNESDTIEINISRMKYQKKCVEMSLSEIGAVALDRRIQFFYYVRGTCHRGFLLTQFIELKYEGFPLDTLSWKKRKMKTSADHSILLLYFFLEDIVK